MFNECLLFFHNPFWMLGFVQSNDCPEVCSSLGVAYHDAGQPEEALEQHQEALKLRTSVVTGGFGRLHSD